MSVRNDDRPRVVYRPPPPPPPPPKRLERIEGCEDAQRAPVDPGKQAAARHVFQRATVNAVREGTDAATGVQPKRGVQSGEQRIEKALQAIDNANGDDARRAAVVKAAETVRDVMAQTRPEARGALLDSVGPQLEKLGRGLDTLKGDETRAAFGHLAQAAESAGRDNVDKIAKPLANAIPQMLEGHGDNKGELLDGIEESITSGKGALLGAALGRHLEPELAGEVNERIGGALDDVREDFAEKHKAAQERDGQLAHVASQWKDVFTPQEMQAGMDRFKSAHGEYADREASAKVLASTLEGAAYGKRVGTLGESADKTLRSADELAQTEEGARIIGEKLVEQGRGMHTFLEEVGKGRDAESAASFQQAIGRSIVATQSENLSAGERRGLAEALRGAASVTEGAMKRGFEDFADVTEKNEGAPPQQFAVKLVESSHGLANNISQAHSPPEQGLSGAKGFQQLGTALGVASVGVGIAGLGDGANGRELAGITLGTAGTATGVAALAGKESAKTLGKAFLPVGLALSTYDTIGAIDRGDKLGAVAAGAPLALAAAGAGIGAATGSFAPLLGTAIGAGAGSVIGLGIGLGRHFFGESPEEKLEKDTQAFLEGALEAKGLPKEAAFRLRDLNGEFVGIGSKISATELERIAGLPDDELEDFVKSRL